MALIPLLFNFYANVIALLSQDYEKNCHYKILMRM